MRTKFFITITVLLKCSRILENTVLYITVYLYVCIRKFCSSSLCFHTEGIWLTFFLMTAARYSILDIWKNFHIH